MDNRDFRLSLLLRTFVTHLVFDKPTMTQEGKYVYLDFVDAFVGGNFGYGDYFEHVAPGYALREQPNVLFLTYEELKKNTRQVALRLAYILGEQYGRALEKDEALLQKVLDRSQPVYMRNVVGLDLSGRRNSQWSEVFSREKATCVEGHGGDENKYAYVRVGNVGTWKDYFTTDLLHKMEHRILEAEKASPFMDLRKDIRAEAMTRMQHT
ncbi:hypothetical protein HPB52_005673 [Rhipicephalus sanguineus]|uniref:Sulfotransferase domain-containing protein n=1 Tax=Rhipicephalus sanguineus TaxID=34632 RepID=A0A9D4PVP1_RHISA|nr:hypothetical protein HPB52_005673 [Rhipicephalus sanguineus]